MAHDLSHALWAKSSRSGSQEDCVEVARNLPGIVAVRDSKNPAGPVVVVTPQQWQRFTAAVKDGAV